MNGARRGEMRQNLVALDARLFAGSNRGAERMDALDDEGWKVRRARLDPLETRRCAFQGVDRDFVGPLCV